MHIVRLQILVWAAVIALIFFSYLPMDGVMQSAAYTIINVSFYAMIIYGNILWLYPRFYEKRQYFLYVVFSVVLLLLMGIGRGYCIMYVYNHFSDGMRKAVTFIYFLSPVLGSVLIFSLSFILRIALAYFKVKQQAEDMLLQKSQAELNLLKSQVQPHFLFNTLNNIYYEAYREAPATAALIEKLSDIMRYFVDESQKERVSLRTELQFIENYISLEKIRIRHGIELIFEKDADEDIRIPPMLLMTFVENIFKHGIDRMSRENRIGITLKQEGAYLRFTTVNPVHPQQKEKEQGGFGIDNLRKRLYLLFATDFELITVKSEDVYMTSLKIPTG